MEYFIGISLALGVSLFGTCVGFDRDRAFYPFMTVVIASTYQLFAAISDSFQMLSLETVAFFGFVLVATVGFRTSLWVTVAALAAHGLFDLAHPHLISNPGVPSWWPMFCMTYDVIAAVYLALLLGLSILPARLHESRNPETENHASWMTASKAIRPHVQAEIDAAASGALSGDFSACFRNLERAHVLSQVSTREHVRVHWHMLVWAARQRNAREFLGQIIRIVGAATKTAIGLVPSGNTGGSNVSAFRRMPTSNDIASILASASRRSR